MKNNLLFLLSIIIIILFALIESPIGISIWAVWLFILRFTAKRFSRFFYSIENLTYFITLCYMLISIVGLVLIYDSIRNYGMQFGYRWDDSAYFFEAKNFALDLIAGKVDVVGVFQTLVGIKILILHFFSFGLLHVELIHVISLNWFLASYIIVLAGHLSHLITKYKVNNNLLLLSTMGNFVFFDSLTRLYRESITIFCVLLTFVLFIQQKKIAAFLPLAIAFLLRGANGFMALGFLVYLQLSQTIKTRVSFIRISIISALLTIAVIYTLPLTCSFLIHYLSDFTRDSTREMYRGYSVEDVIRARTGFHMTRKGRGETLTFAYQHGGLIGGVIRTAHSLFFPLRVALPIISKRSYGSVVKSGYVYHGFFLYAFIRNIHVVLLSIIIPLFLFGCYDLMKNNTYTKVTLLYYIIVLLLTTFVSMQIRHYLAFMILNPVIVLSGYSYFLKKRKSSLLLFSSLTISIIISYNIIRFF